MPKIRVKLATNIVTTPVSTLSSTTPRIFHIFAPGQRPVLKTVHQHVTRQRQRQCWYLVTVVEHLCHLDWKDFQHRNLVRPEAGNCEKSIDSWDYSSETALNRPTKKLYQTTVSQIKLINNHDIDVLVTEPPWDCDISCNTNRTINKKRDIFVNKYK